jgi:hypothetical protein
MRHNAYADGYQDALRELAEILDRHGPEAMAEYLRLNAAPPAPLVLSRHPERETPHERGDHSACNRNCAHTL